MTLLAGHTDNHYVPTTFYMSSFGEYHEDHVGGCCKMRDYKDATDLVVIRGQQEL